MISKLMIYAFAVALTACLGLGVWVWVQGGVIEALRDDLAASAASLSVCEDRQEDILNQREREHEIESLGADALRERASEWLLDF
jgi:hypothetical protein